MFQKIQMKLCNDQLKSHIATHLQKCTKI